jgi:HK97 family phage portal protein
MLKALRAMLPGGQKGKTIDEIAREIDDAGYGRSFAGKSVTSVSALQVSAVYACVRIISEGVATLPFRVYREENGERLVDRNNSIYRLLAQKPNAWQTPAEFLEGLVFNAAFAADGFAIKNVVRGEVRELLPVMPGQVRERQASDYSISYDVTTAGGVLNFAADQMFHLRGPFRGGGANAPKPIQMARNAIGLAIASEELQSKLFDNGGRPGGILSTPAGLSPDARDALRKEWKESFGGARNAFKVAVLDGENTFEQMAMSGVDAQTLESRRFQVEEVCRYFNVFPQVVMHTDKTTTYASAESFFSGHVRQTLRPWGVRVAQAADRDIGDQEGPLTSEFDTSPLTQATVKDQSEADRSDVELGILTRNEVRTRRGLPPIAGLDDPLTPMNMNEGGSDASTTA